MYIQSYFVSTGVANGSRWEEKVIYSEMKEVIKGHGGVKK